VTEGNEVASIGTARLPFNGIETVADEIGREAFAKFVEVQRTKALPKRIHNP
jgi:hypothetical protein